MAKEPTEPRKPTVRQIQADLLYRIQTEGALAGYEAALSVAGDQKSPANARASASRTLLQAARLLERGNGVQLEKEPHEMSPEELSAAVAMSMGRFQEKSTGDDLDEDDQADDIFN